MNQQLSRAKAEEPQIPWLGPKPKGITNEDFMFDPNFLRTPPHIPLRGHESPSMFLLQPLL